MPESEIALRYGMNPHQAPARALADRGALPFEVRNGAPGYINLLDALNSWQLVRELRAETGLPAAASFKHASPAGAAVGSPLSSALAQAYFVEGMELSPLAAAYARARGADRVSSFGDWIALSDEVDESAARLIRREVSDGVIAPGFTPEAAALLAQKQGGRYCVLQADASYEPPEEETRTVFGVRLQQRRNDASGWRERLSDAATGDAPLPESAVLDLATALIALKYTQSNSVCLAVDGQVIGNGAGQQSRIHCTRLAASKADAWRLRQHPAALGLRFRDGIGRPERDNAVDGFLRDDLAPAEERLWLEWFAERPQRLTPEQRREWLDGMDGVAMASDGFIPFRDNVDRAAMSGVRYIAQPGGSVRDADVAAACAEHGIAMALTGVRLFHH